MDESEGDKLLSIKNGKTEKSNNNEDLIIRELMDEEMKEKAFLEIEEEK
jgi:hypothetical protein